MENKLTGRTAQAVAAICGIAAALYACGYVVWASFVLTHGLQPDYNWVNATISELGVPGTPLAAPTAIMFIVTGALQIVFAGGLYFWLVRGLGADEQSGSRLSAMLGALMIAARKDSSTPSGPAYFRQRMAEPAKPWQARYILR